MAADTFTGQGADDTFTGLADYTDVTENSASTFNVATDVLDGAGGYDTLALTLSSSGVGPKLTLDPSKIRNIERLSVASTATLAEVALTGTSFTELVSNRATSGMAFTGFGSSVTKLGVTGPSSGNVTFTPDGVALAGTADAITLTLTDVGTSSQSPIVSLTPSGGVATDFYETLNIVSSVATGAANYIRLAMGTNQTSLTRINISGSAPLSLNFPSNDNARAVQTIDASAATGALTIGSTTATLGVADQTVILGSGTNLVYFGANLDGNDTVDGSRGGNDTLAVIASTNTSPFNAGAFAHVTGVETLRVSGVTTLIQDFSVLPTSVTTLQFAQTSPFAYTLNKLASGMTVELLATPNNSATITLSLANNSASDALTLKFNFPTTPTPGQHAERRGRPGDAEHRLHRRGDDQPHRPRQGHGQAGDHRQHRSDPEHVQRCRWQRRRRRVHRQCRALQAHDHRPNPQRRRQHRAALQERHRHERHYGPGRRRQLFGLGV